MGYYIRIFGKEDPDIDINALLKSLEEDGISIQLNLDPSENKKDWTTVEVANDLGDVFMTIERNPVVKGKLGFDELAEFREEIENYKPSSSAKWLKNYFEKVKVIYAFQFLDGALEDRNFEALNSIKTYIWNKTGGILQADLEGFSNEDGYHILWQFSENVTGDWNMALLESKDKWTNFRMNLGDKVQRGEFFEGKVPKNAIII